MCEHVTTPIPRGCDDGVAPRGSGGEWAAHAGERKEPIMVVTILSVALVLGILTVGFIFIRDNRRRTPR